MTNLRPSSVHYKTPKTNFDRAVDALLRLECAFAHAGLKNLKVKNLDNLRSASPERIDLCFEKADRFATLVNAAVEKGVPIKKGKSFTWFLLQQFGIAPHSKLFDLVDESDHVEVVTPDGVPLFSNVNFMLLVSHGIDDFFSKPWNELFDRQPFFTAQIHREFARAFKTNGPFRPMVTPHEAWEVGVENPTKAIVEMKVFCVLNSRLIKSDVLFGASKIDVLS